MPKTYSHSKLNTFEQCPLKFKYKYIDKIPPKIKVIEAHLGSVVHSTLEWIYTKVKNNKIPTIEEVISYYTNQWKEDYKPEMIIVKEDSTIEDYFSKGIQFILDYYSKHKPFDDNTIEIEKKIIINLNGEYEIQGFIDRLSYNLKNEEYEVHDYKTANTLPNKEGIENDRQLALYSIAVKELFGKDKKVCLVWHYLAHNQEICIRKTENQLQQLKEEILNLIKQIEATKKFPPYISRLCDWCGYKPICPIWNQETNETN